jgi:hypothetical protein
MTNATESAAGGPAQPDPKPAPARAPAAEKARPAAAPAHILSSGEPHSVVIRPYPKSIFLYPIALTALVCGIFTAAGIGAERTLGFIFCLVFFFNVVILSFEFTRHVSVALVLSVFVVVLLGMLLNQRVALFHFLGVLYGKLNFVANAGFYFAIFGAYVLVLGGIVVDTRMDYWEVRGNEVLHHHGFLGDVERFPAPSLKMRKEIADVFEYLLLWSGRLIIYPTGSERAIVLDNVPNINKIEDRIEELLDSLRVTIETKT